MFQNSHFQSIYAGVDIWFSQERVIARADARDIRHLEDCADRDIGEFNREMNYIVRRDEVGEIVDVDGHVYIRCVFENTYQAS